MKNILRPYETDHVFYNLSNGRILDLPDSSIHLTVTSPPYVVTEFIEGQEFDYDGFVATFKAFCNQLFAKTVPGGRFALNVADIVTKYRFKGEGLLRMPLGPDLLRAACDAGFLLVERFIWDKGYTRNFKGPLLGSYPYPLTIFNNNYFEYIYVLKRPGARKMKQEVRVQSRLSLEEWRKWSQQWWRVESITEKFKVHPAVFPLDIPTRLIRMYSYVGDTVLDPYAGTGATLIAADVAGRKSICFEHDSRAEEWLKARIRFELSRGSIASEPIHEFIADG